MKNTKVSGKVPFKFLITMTVDKGGEKIKLAGAGMPAIGKNSASRTLPSLRLDVTRVLRQYLSGAENTKSIDIYIEPVDARGRPLPTLDWSVEKVVFETAD